jgi:tRNA-splicing ligase RtcB
MDISGLKKRGDFEWEIPQIGEMNRPVRIFASEKILKDMDEKVREQATNVACLPGIQKASLAMPDAHWGYGFPIGGVAAFDPEDNGVICMGGIGFDISCGVRVLNTGMKKEDIKPKINDIIESLFNVVPAGLGSQGEVRLDFDGIDEVLMRGARWAVEQGYGLKDDLRFVEENGMMEGANPKCVSEKAKRRQFKQVGTLGSGNHYLEIQYVDEIYDQERAKVLGLERESVVIAIHCGSRALGHQIGTDYLKELYLASKKYNIPIRERELVCAPINSPEGEKYFSAVKAGINCALANRQVIAHLVREGFHHVFPDARIGMLYDISHNTCKVEEHLVDGEKKTLYIHRKGSTRAFGPGREEIPREYRSIGQPVLIGGTMGTYSFILTGTNEGREKAFNSACHGAGRAMSRKKAKKIWHGKRLIKDLAMKGIIVKSHSYAGAAEEAPGAYKDVAEVVDSVQNAGLAKKVVRVRPLAVVKG